MKVLHVIPSVNAGTGGPSQSVTQLTRHLAARGEDVRLISLDYSLLGDVQSIGNAEIELLPARFAAVHFRGFSRRLAGRINALAKNYDVVHNHGLWMWPNLYARRAAIRNDRPLVISPRGMLESWALQRGRLKKALFWRFFERENLSKAAMFHATSQAEAESIRALQLQQPIAVIPNAVEIPVLDTLPGRAALEDQHPELRRKRWLLFLSRLHIKKGIFELLSVWRDIHRDFSDWQLLIAGSLNGTDGQIVVEQIRRNAVPVTLLGHIQGEQKAAALRHADLFVLPSYSENFGIAIAEALAHATAVITTTATPWHELRDSNAGWCIAPGEKPLRQVLPMAMARSSDELKGMGLSGRKLIDARHNWAKVAGNTAAAYQWLLMKDQVPKPDFVLTNGVAA